VDVNGWLAELLDFFEPACADADVRLERQLGPSLPQIMVDRDLMKQAVLNLLNNAVQAMHGGGTLRVRTWSTGDRVRIEVSDTGTGIPPDVLPRIFDPYFTTRDAGTGLGLPTVRRIVAEHGGEIGVESRLGHGTTFTVTLPVPPNLAGEELRGLPGARVVSGDEAASHLVPPSPSGRPSKAGDR
jgi:signal transduction histidine kinase